MKKQTAGERLARWIGYAFIIVVTAWLTATVVGWLTGAAANAIV